MHFPVVFSLKVVGEDEKNLESIITTALKNNAVDSDGIRISKRPSREGKYQAFTVTFMAKSQEQLDSIYKEISGNPAVIFAL